MHVQRERGRVYKHMYACIYRGREVKIPIFCVREVLAITEKYVIFSKPFGKMKKKYVASLLHFAMVFPLREDGSGKIFTAVILTRGFYSTNVDEGLNCFLNIPNLILKLFAGGCSISHSSAFMYHK